MDTNDILPIPRLPRRLRDDGWWLATPAPPRSARIIPFPTSGRARPGPDDRALRSADAGRP